MLNYEKTINPNSDEWVLFLHGLGGSINTWKYQKEQFEKQYNILLVDLDGHGDSSYNKKLTKYKPNQMARTINRILVHEKIQKVHIISLSLGTLVALEFTRLYPKKVSSIILAGCIINLDKKREMLLAAAQRIKNLLPLEYTYKLFAHILMPNKNHKKSRDIFIRESLKMKKQAFARWLNSLHQSQGMLRRYIKMLNKNKIPTLFVSGREDYVFLDGIKGLRKKIRNFNLKVLKNCGHVCSIEKAKLFNNISFAFLKKNKKTGDK